MTTLGLHDSAEGFVALEQEVERFQGAQILCRERLSLVPRDKAPEPFAQRPSLIRNLVELARQRLRPDGPQHIDRHKLGLFQPIQQTFAVIDPIDRRINRRRDRIEEIQSERIADKNRRCVLTHLRAFPNAPPRPELGGDP